MNTSENTPENASSDQSRPFGFWITASDRLLAARFATAFEDEGITRREWRVLNVVDGTVPIGRELPDRALRPLLDLGWIERTADGWALTADGSAARARLSTAVEEIRDEVAALLDPEEFATMAASLEKLARGLGYEEGMRLPRRRGTRRDGDRDHRRGHGHHRHGRSAHGEHRDHDGRHGHGEHSVPCEHAGHHGRHGHGERRHGERTAHDERAAFGRFAEQPGFGRFAEQPGFGREWLRREHGHGEHAGGRGPRGGHHRHAPTHLHIHLHDGRHNG